MKLTAAQTRELLARYRRMRSRRRRMAFAFFALMEGRLTPADLQAVDTRRAK